MRRNEIRHKILFLSRLFREFIKHILKFFKNLDFRLAHIMQNLVRAMLGRNLELTRNVIFDKLLEKRVVLILQKVVKAYSGTHENLFYTFKITQFSQYIQIFLMIYSHIFARSGKQALPIFAGARFKLFFAGREPEIRCGTSDIVDISLKIGVVYDFVRLLQNGFFAS